MPGKHVVHCSKLMKKSLKKSMNELAKWMHCAIVLCKLFSSLIMSDDRNFDNLQTCYLLEEDEDNLSFLLIAQDDLAIFNKQVMGKKQKLFLTFLWKRARGALFSPTVV